MVTLWCDRTQVTCDAPGCDESREAASAERRVDIVTASGHVVGALRAEGWAFDGADHCACPQHAAAGVR